MAFSKPPQILTVSWLLSKEDVIEILYLSEDFIPQSSTYIVSKCIKWVTFVLKYPSPTFVNTPSGVATPGHTRACAHVKFADVRVKIM